MGRSLGAKLGDSKLQTHIFQPWFNGPALMKKSKPSSTSEAAGSIGLIIHCSLESHLWRTYGHGALKSIIKISSKWLQLYRSSKSPMQKHTYRLAVALRRVLCSFFTVALSGSR